MKVILSNPDMANFAALKERISDWYYLVVVPGSQTPECCIEHDHWLGCSRDGRIWAIATSSDYPNEDRKHGLQDDLATWNISAFLLDPPKRYVNTISEILVRVHIASISCSLGSDTLDRIIAAVPFQEPRRVADYFPEAPEDWLDLPAEIAVDFDLSEGVSVSSRTVDEFARNSLEDVIVEVYSPRKPGLLLGYTLVACHIIPFLAWDVDWPLSRRGDQKPRKREKVQGAVPWMYEPDQSLLTVHQSVSDGPSTLSPRYYEEPSIRLRVGGKTSDEAIANWHQCAKYLRALKRQLI